MRKTTVIIMITFLIGACAQNKNQDIKTLQAFFDEVVLTENYTNEDLLKFFNVENDESIALLKYQIKNLKTKFQQNSDDYQIIAHNDINNYELSSNLEYNNYDEVYYLVINEALIAPLIIKNDRLISISFALYKTLDKKNKYPMLLEEL
ncbi:MAG: hypothetical protein AAFX55_19965 [Bacteroidota bacterium]